MAHEIIASDWMREHFSDQVASATAAIVEAGRAAHDRSLEAKEGSRLPTNEAYGATFWLALPDEVEIRLSFLPNLRTVKPPRSRYRLLVHDGVLLFPAKIIDDSAAKRDKMRLRKSHLRAQIFELSAHDSDQLSLIEEPDESADIIEAARAALGDEATSMILIAYVCNAQGGLQHVFVGDAMLDSDGYVLWSHREELPLHQNLEIPGLVAAADTSFDSAPLPRPTLGLVGDAEDTDTQPEEESTE